MSNLKEYYFEDKYLVRDKSSSDGSQIKYYKDNIWYKSDYHGGEGESEYLSSLLLSCTNLEPDKYVQYDRVLINGKDGCCSKDFRQHTEEEFITLYRLYKNVHGRDLANVTAKMDYDDAIMYVIDFVHKLVGLDITTYLANTFWLDAIILNTDRHFNNYGIIMCNDDYREAPIFDNGKSLLTGVTFDSSSESISEAIRNIYSKSFSPNFSLNYNYLKDHCTVRLDKDLLKKKLSEVENSLQYEVLMYQVERNKNV